MHPLDGPRRKLDRASEHINTFNDAVRRWYDTKPFYVVGGDFDSDKTAYVYRVHMPLLPVFFSIVAGDIFYNLRSALDHLAFQLALIGPDFDSRRDGWEKDVEFPIFVSLEKAKVRSRFERLLNYFPESARPIIRQLQPFEPRFTGEGHPSETHALWVLNELCNCDKHRMVTVNGGIAEISLKPGQSQHWLNDETIGITIPAADKNLPPPIPQMRFYLLLGRSVIGNGFKVDMIPILHKAIAKGVIPRFERFFP